MVKYATNSLSFISQALSNSWLEIVNVNQILRRFVLKITEHVYLDQSERQGRGGYNTAALMHSMILQEAGSTWS